MTALCTSRTTSGVPCRAPAVHGTQTCRWHDPSPEAKARHKAESARGGLAKAYAAIPAGSPLADDPDVASLDLSTAAGLRAYLAATLHALARLPMDVRQAHAVAALVNAQRSTIETADLEHRLAALERQAPPGLRVA